MTPCISYAYDTYEPEYIAQETPAVVKRARGCQVNTSKLDAAKVLAIRASNLTATELAKIYGVTKGAIAKIIHRESWAWL